MGELESATVNLNTAATATAVGCIINSKRMFGWIIAYQIYNSSNNASCVVETCKIRQITNWAGKNIIFRLGCARLDNV